MEEKEQKKLKETLNSLEGAGGMEEEKHIIFHYFDSIHSSKIFWRNGGRETLKSLEGTGGMEEDKIVIYSTILNLFNHSKSVGGMEEEGQKKFDRDSKFSGGSQRNGGRQAC